MKRNYNPIRYYKKFKRQYLQFVVFIKYGSVYLTYDSDAKIVSYVLDFSLDEDAKIKILKENFGEVVKILHDNGLNVVLTGSKNVSEYYCEKESQYMKIRAKSKEYARSTKSSVH